MINKFVMAAGKVDVSYKKISMLALYVEPLTDTYEVFWNWVEHCVDDALGAEPQIISP